MARTAAVVLYLAGLVFAEALRIPRRLARLRSQPLPQRAPRSRLPMEPLVIGTVILGIWVLPLIYSFTGWLQPFDYSLPVWAVWVAAPVFVASLIIRWTAQRTLGRQWSCTVEAPPGHRLVTTGIYAAVRHPIYASLLLWAAAQPALLQNLIAGWGGPVAIAAIWILRVPEEEKVLGREFGDEYRRYMDRTGRVLPKCRSRGRSAR